MTENNDSVTRSNGAYRCLMNDCKSENVDLVLAGPERVHISCNDCGWLHRDVPTEVDQ